MREIFVLTSIGAILVVCFLILYFVGTIFAIIGSIVMSPIFWGIIVVLFVVGYFKRKL